ncbi:hypothetical protein V9T40_002807 [Parthenolecanium corni]|uniref:Uncharacterized protein n=1 Tax=Parthenolecanium corni TaxID=536013 RepID=A0AAN9TL31_9HEMI
MSLDVNVTPGGMRESNLDAEWWYGRCEWKYLSVRYWFDFYGKRVQLDQFEDPAGVLISDYDTRSSSSLDSENVLEFRPSENAGQDVVYYVKFNF